MFKGLLTRIAGDANRRELERLQPIVGEINSLEPELEGLSDEELRLKTGEFKARLQRGEPLDDLMVEAFAVVREAAKRTVYMRHFDVQLMGGIVLHQGKVAEMKTGEGKTLVATLPLYLNALQGEGAHLVTVNDYLARRDTQWMGPVYNFLGLSVGLLQQGGKAFLYDPSYEKGDFGYLRPVERKEAYLADITYGTNNEFGFDYLRDNMAQELSQRVQRGLRYAIIDEADYILIDEARTPLIISGPSHEPIEEYTRFAQIAKGLQPEIDYEVDLRDRVVTLTDQGLAKVERELGLLNIYSEQNYRYVHYLEQALKAKALYKRDGDYIRQGQNIILIDEFTGRLMPHRRLSEGLHQAIEAKEGVRIKPRTMTYATITLQNFFRLYEKLAGMTGTAATAAEELYQIYGLDVVIIPTNEPMIRIDHPDLVYRTEEAKWKAILDEIEECHQDGRPVLVGTTSVEKSERLSRKLKGKGIPHQVLNAKNHAKEAAIIARAGEPGAVTVATKMAGRGVDIKLGGELSQETIKRAHEVLRRRGINPFRASQAQLDSAIAEVAPRYALHREKVLELGGLYIVGSERHEARRIDDQLRGRSGRQGDPGSSRFYLSLEDDLMQRFGGPNVANLMQRLGLEEDVPIEHGLVSKAIESAQNRVEGYNFDIRKHLLEYDDVLNSQRQMIYDQRYKILTKEDLGSDLWGMVKEEIEDRISQADSPWELMDYLDRIVPLSFPPSDSPIRYPLLFANLTCLPPFSISFLAEKLGAEALGPHLMEISRQAFEAYGEHLLDRAVDERVKWAEEHYDEDLDAYTTRLERMTEDFLSAQAGGGWGYLLQGLQKSFPLRLDLKPSEIRGLGADEVREELLAALEESYHRSICEALIKTAEGRTPEALELAQFKPLDLEHQDLIDLFEWAKDEEAEALAKIERRAKEGEYRDSLIQLLLDLNDLTFLDIEALCEILRRMLAKAYDRWAERQLREIEASIRSGLGELKQPSTKEIIQLLLDVYHAERTFFDRDHKRRISPVPRIPLAFLAATSIRDKEPEQLRRQILTHLKALLKARENLWGEEALRTMSQQRLDDLGMKVYDGFAEFLGAGMVKGEEGIGNLGEEVRENVRQYLEMRRLEQYTWAELDPQLREGITEYLDQRLTEDMERRASNLDEETRAEVRRYLLEEGYFDDKRRKKELFRRKVNEMDRGIQEEIAQYWGRKLLMEMEEKPIAELDEATRRLILRCLRGGGHFIDEGKLQHFLTHQRLSDLGEETCWAVVQHLNQKRLEDLKDKKIGNLPLDIRRGTMAYLEKKGCFTDEDRRRGFAHQKVGDLEEGIHEGLIPYLGHQQLGRVRRIADLQADLRAGLRRHLREEGFLIDERKAAAFPDMRLSDLGEALGKARHTILQKVKGELDQYPIGQLGEELGESIIGYLREIGYFTDEEKEHLFQQPLAALEPNVLHGLESHLGHRLMDEMEERKFLNLDQETRRDVLGYFDERGFLKGRSERRRFIQRGRLSDLEGGIYDGLAYYLGCRMLAEIKGLGFAQLPDEVRKAIWAYLEGSGYFVDGELVALVRESRVADLEPRVREAILSRLAGEIEEEFAKNKVADLKGYICRGLRRYLEGTDYFTDEEKVCDIEQTEVTALDGEIRETVAGYLGQCLLRRFEGQRIADMEGEVQEGIWSYLDETGYFLDEARKESYAERRLPDLEPGILSGLAEHLACRLKEEIEGRKVADLEDDFRQAIRAYLLSQTDLFLSQAEVEEFERRRLADLGEGDRQAVALSFGRRRLEEIGCRRLMDLEEEAQEGIKHRLREQGYFFDQGKWRRFQQRPLSDSGDETRTGLLEHLRRKRAEVLEGHRIADLGEEMRRRILDYLHQESSRSGGFEGQGLAYLELELRDDLPRHLGYWKLEGSKGRRITDLDDELRRALRRYLGRRAMHEVQKRVMLGAIDRLWVEHLTDMEDLRQGIGLESFGQRDPLVEYKRKAYNMFQDLLADIRRTVVGSIYRASPQSLQLAKA